MSTNSDEVKTIDNVSIDSVSISPYGELTFDKLNTIITDIESERRKYDFPSLTESETIKMNKNCKIFNALITSKNKKGVRITYDDLKNYFEHGFRLWTIIKFNDNGYPITLGECIATMYNTSPDLIDILKSNGWLLDDDKLFIYYSLFVDYDVDNIIKRSYYVLFKWFSPYAISNIKLLNDNSTVLHTLINNINFSKSKNAPIEYAFTFFDVVELFQKQNFDFSVVIWKISEYDGLCKKMSLLDIVVDNALENDIPTYIIRKLYDLGARFTLQCHTIDWFKIVEKDGETECMFYGLDCPSVMKLIYDVFCANNIVHKIKKNNEHNDVDTDDDIYAPIKCPNYEEEFYKICEIVCTCLDCDYNLEEYGDIHVYIEEWSQYVKKFWPQKYNMFLEEVKRICKKC